MRMAGFAVILLAAGCSGSPQGNISGAETPRPAAPDTVSDTSPASPASTAPAPEGAAIPGKLPSPDTEYRYVGRWAATEQLCASSVWRFEPQRLVTAGEVSCTFDSVDKAPGGYDIHATCTAEAPPQPDLIKLRFAESAQAMLVESQVLSPTGLIYCGPLK
jgi:hypothetical protein